MNYDYNVVDKCVLADHMIEEINCSLAYVQWLIFIEFSSANWTINKMSVQCFIYIKKLLLKSGYYIAWIKDILEAIQTKCNGFIQYVNKFLIFSWLTLSKCNFEVKIKTCVYLITNSFFQNIVFNFRILIFFSRGWIIYKVIISGTNINLHLTCRNKKVTYF